MIVVDVSTIGNIKLLESSCFKERWGLWESGFEGSLDFERRNQIPTFKIPIFIKSRLKNPDFRHPIENSNTQNPDFLKSRLSSNPDSIVEFA